MTALNSSTNLSISSSLLHLFILHIRFLYTLMYLSVLRQIYYMDIHIVYFIFIHSASYQDVISTGMALEKFFCLKPCCFEEFLIDCFFAIRVKRYMIKKANQEYVTFNKPVIYFYLIDASLFVYTFPCSKAYIKITSQK